MKYHTELVKEEIPTDRAIELAVALNQLHSAITKLDNKNLTQFWTKSIELRLREFAAVENVNKDCLSNSY